MDALFLEQMGRQGYMVRPFQANTKNSSKAIRKSPLPVLGPVTCKKRMSIEENQALITEKRRKGQPSKIGMAYPILFLKERKKPMYIIRKIIIEL